MANIIKLRNIRQALCIEPSEAIKYVLSGRVNNYRPYKSFNFIDLTDGSSSEHIQVVMPKNILSKPELGSYLTCLGNLVPSRGVQQVVEFKVEELKHLGQCNPLVYPLAVSAPSAAETLDNNWYRKYTHLRPRAGHFSSLLRVRSELELSLHMIMKQMDFFRVHTPSLTSNDSEASSDLFTVKRTKICNTEKEEGAIEDDENQEEEEGEEEGEKKQRVIRDEYFNKDVYLITSAQLHLENLASALSRVYTMTTAFRAENSISTRHLCEFLMFELEESNIENLEPLMDRAESIIKFVAQYLHEISEHKSDFSLLLDKNANHGIFDKLTRSPFIRMSYSEALQSLKTRTGFTGDTSYGSDIGRLHEKELLDYCNNVPIFITDYPKQLKPFYMKCDQSDNEAQCFDLIAPHGGEICGGSLREDSLDKLLINMKRNHPSSANDEGLDDFRHFEWYLDTRRFGSFPHGGFGIGFERLIQSLLGIKNIKDTTAFPRWVRHCPM